MLKRAIIISLLVLTLSATAAIAGGKSYTLKFNTVAGPQQPEVKGMEVFAKEVERLSEGKVKVQVFHSGQLGNQQTQMLGVMRGTIDMSFTDPNTMAQMDKRLGLLGAAYLFRDLAHMYTVMEGPIGKDYFDGIAKNQGLRPLDVWYLGTRQLNLRDKPVHTPNDMLSVKLRVPNSPQWIAMGKALGANPTPMSFGELYLALKTGVVDGQDNPLPTDKVQKFNEVTKYIILTNHQLGMIWPSINERLWQGMPPQYREWILQALRTARMEQNRIVLESEAALLGEFKQNGMTIIKPDVEAFRRNARAVYKEFEAEWGPGMYDKIQSIK